MHQQKTRGILFSLLLPIVHHWPQWFTLSLLVWPGEPVWLGELARPGPGRQWKLHLECRQDHWHSRSSESKQVKWWWQQCASDGMPGFALFTVVETDKFKESLPVQCTSSGRRMQSPRKRQGNDDIMEEAVTRRRFVGKAAMA